MAPSVRYGLDMQDVIDWISFVGGLYSADEWAAIWTFATFVVALIAAVVALSQFGHHIRTTREQSRPFVIVDFEFSSGTVFIEVRNTGTTAARDVRFEWDSIPHADDERSEGALQRALVTDGMPFLAPGRSIRFLLAGFTESLQPRRFTVKARYRAPNSRRWWDSRSVLDLDQWAQAVATTDSTAKMAKSAEKQARAAEKTAKATERVGRLLEPLSKVLRDSATYRRIEEQEEAEYQQRIEQFHHRMSIREATLADADSAKPQDGEIAETPSTPPSPDATPTPTDA